MGTIVIESSRALKVVSYQKDRTSEYYFVSSPDDQGFMSQSHITMLQRQT